MIFFIGLRALLRKAKDDTDMGQRGKRKKKFNNNQNKPNWKESEALEVVSKDNRKKKDEEDKRKPFERVVLPPPRDAQEGHI